MELRKIILFVCLSFSTIGLLRAEKIKGIVLDKTLNEPLIGATVQVEGTAKGAVTDLDGFFELKDVDAKVVLIVKYVSFQTQRIEVDVKKTQDLKILMEPDEKQIGEVTVVARKNLEGEQALLQERRMANVAVENIGAKEMSVKGISTVEEGVKKITGVSIA